MFGFYNIWLFFVIGYGIIWASMIWAGKKRGKPIEDPELYKRPGVKKCFALGWIWIILLFVICLFIPVNSGSLFWVGLPLYLIGIIINLFAMYSFAKFSGGVNTTGIYRYSRNPMYVGGFFFLLGLCLMGLSTSVWSIILIIFFIISIPYYNRVVLLEEAFLEHKYGETYTKYKQNVPRYIFNRKNRKEVKYEQ